MYENAPQNSATTVVSRAPNAVLCHRHCSDRPEVQKRYNHRAGPGISDESATPRLSRSGYLPAYHQRQNRSRRRGESDEINPFPRTGRECGDDIVQLEISTRHQPPRSPGRISDDWLEPRTALIRGQRSEVGGQRSDNWSEFVYPIRARSS